MANISTIVNVNAVIQAGGLVGRDFGIGLFVTPDTTLGNSIRLQQYADLDAVEAVFPTTSSPFKAAFKWFSQSPFPKNYMIGRWFKVDTAATLISGTLPALATITAVADGSLEINTQIVSLIDFTSDVSYTDVAATLEAALIGASVNVSVAYDSLTNSFTIKTVAVGVAATLTYATVAFLGTDLSALLLLDSPTAKELNQGINAETIDQAMDAFVSINDTFYFINLDQSEIDTSTVTDLSNWVSTRNYIFYIDSEDVQALVTDDSTSTFAQLFAAQSQRTIGDWHTAFNEFTDPEDTSSYLAVSSAARLSSVDFDGSQAVINPAYKARPGLTPDTFTDSQTAELNRKRVNRLVTVGGGTVSPTVQNIYEFGTCFANGIWVDIRYGLDWFVNRVQVDVMNLLTETDKIPQTVQGQSLIKATIEAVCRQAITNGLVAPGFVSDATSAQIKSITGNSSFAGTLALGYLVFPQPLSTLSEADRIARKIPPFYVWLKGSGAVNSIDINVVFDQ